MKALTVRQPYATEIIRGRKTLEVRSRPTTRRGPLAIHAAQAAADGWEWEEGGEAEFPRGVVMGTVNVTGCRPFTPADVGAAYMLPEEFCEGLWAWELAEPRAVKQFPAKGKLNLWQLDEALLQTP